MAVLTSLELAKLRRDLAFERNGVIDWNRNQANAMFQAIENALAIGGTAAAAINAAIESSAAAGVFSAAEKNSAAKVLLRLRGV